MCFYVLKDVRDASFRAFLAILEINRFLFAFTQFIQIFLLLIIVIPVEYKSSSGIQQSSRQYVIMYILNTWVSEYIWVSIYMNAWVSELVSTFDDWYGANVT